jgi:anti-sigma regulatory factor (Ser/Thr protein kinase)
MRPAPPHAGLDHRALVHAGLEGFAAGAGAFVREGLEREEAVCVVVGAAAGAALRDALGADARAVEFADAQAWYASPVRAIAALTARFAGDRPLRSVGEVPVTGFGDRHAREWYRYEAIVEHAFGERRGALLCAYDARLPEEVLAGVRATHGVVDGGAAARRGRAVDALGSLHARPLDAPPARAEALRFDDRPAPAREFATARAAAVGLTGRALDDLRVAVSEILTNAIVHGERPHMVHVWRDDGRVVCEVSDGGGGIESPLTGFLVPDRALPGGRGVWIARQLCDLVEVSGARVRLHMRLG